MNCIYIALFYWSSTQSALQWFIHSYIGTLGLPSQWEVQRRTVDASVHTFSHIYSYTNDGGHWRQRGVSVLPKDTWHIPRRSRIRTADLPIMTDMSLATTLPVELQHHTLTCSLMTPGGEPCNYT